MNAGTELTDDVPKDQATASDAPLDPPRTLGRILMSVGPGLIVAGSIVGSGELIATTKTGAESGFSLLWLILIGCVIKVFAQIEFGRYAIASGKTTLKALDEVPGPRIKGRGNWLVWYWVLMWLASISQLGGIVGGVGQSLAISAPLTQQGKVYNVAADAEQLRLIQEYRGIDSNETRDNDQLWEEYDASYPAGEEGTHRQPSDAAIWAVLMALLTSVILVIGRYNLIQTLSTVLVASFTALVVVNLFALQSKDEFSVSMSEFLSGLTFSIPKEVEGINPIGTALATFGIIGVGAAELITYPYWCLEKGYGKFTGRNDGSEAWKQRAAGWMRVMHVDAWGSMVIYTFATIAFFLLGASVLHRVGLNPEKTEMVRTLAVMFQPVFSKWAAMIFLFGAFAVLYSTFFVSNAAHARTFADAMQLTGVIADTEDSYRRWVKILSGVFPILCVVIFLRFQAPAKLVLISGIAQGVMLPMLAGAALYFRYKRNVDGLTPSRTWDVFLWVSGFAMLITGTWTVVNVIAKNL